MLTRHSHFNHAYNPKKSFSGLLIVVQDSKCVNFYLQTDDNSCWQIVATPDVYTMIEKKLLRKNGLAVRISGSLTNNQIHVTQGYDITFIQQDNITLGINWIIRRLSWKSRIGLIFLLILVVYSMSSTAHIFTIPAIILISLFAIFHWRSLFT